MPLTNNFDRETQTKEIVESFPLSAAIAQGADGKSFVVDITTTFTPDAGGSAITKTVCRVVLPFNKISKKEIQFLSKFFVFPGNAANYVAGGLVPALAAASPNKSIVDMDAFLSAGGVQRKDPEPD